MTPSERLGRLYAGVIYDAMTFDLAYRHPFVLHPAIRPAWPPGDTAVCGPAFTCRGEPVRSSEHVDDFVRIEMLRSFTPGCVQVLDTGGDRSVAHFGDISGKLARRHGAVALVTDGFTRDARILERDRFPVYCTGIQPVDAFGRWQIVEHGRNVELPGADGRVRVRPGDLVFADADGVLVLPQELAAELCTYAERRLAREDEVRRRLAASADPEALYHEVGRW